MSGDFNGEDFEFAVGTIKGLRSWSIDDKGRLTGVSHRAVWKPGENVAKCRAGAGRYTPCPKQRTFQPGLSSLYTSCGDPTCVPYQGHFVATPPHDFDPECGCGFWAYDEVGFVEHGDAVGVIEGYGRSTIGTKGFRCEKARIVALCRETDNGTLSLSEWLRLKELYPDAEFFDELDPMVLAHGQVMRTWPVVDDDFWCEEEPQAPLDRTSFMNALLATALNTSFNTSFRPGGFLPSPPPSPASVTYTTSQPQSDRGTVAERIRKILGGP